MKNIILLLLISGLLFSCSTSRTVQESGITNELESSSLEQFLIKNNKYIKIPLTKMASGH